MAQNISLLTCNTENNMSLHENTEMHDCWSDMLCLVLEKRWSPLGLDLCFEVGMASKAKTQGKQNYQYMASISWPT